MEHNDGGKDNNLFDRSKDYIQSSLGGLRRKYFPIKNIMQKLLGGNDDLKKYIELDIYPKEFFDDDAKLRNRLKEAMSDDAFRFLHSELL